MFSLARGILFYLKPNDLLLSLSHSSPLLNIAYTQVLSRSFPLHFPVHLQQHARYLPVHPETFLTLFSPLVSYVSEMDITPSELFVSYTMTR